MNNDRELLELAAKAAGYKMDDETSVYHNEQGKIWNPLTDDGDALRLAVKIGMELDIYEPRIAVRTNIGIKVLEEFNDDLYAATRRAIVRAAAEIGRTM